MSWTRLVLKEPESKSQFQTFAFRADWMMDEIVQATDERPFEIVYSDARHDVGVSYIEDERLGLMLVLVSGERHAEVASLIRAQVAVVTHDFVLSAANGANAPMDHVKAAYLAAGTASSDFDQALFGVIEQAAGHEDPPVRHAALLAIAYVEWPECRALLERLSDDEDDGVKQVAQSMLDAWPP